MKTEKSERLKQIDEIYLRACRNFRNKGHLVLTNIFMWHYEFDICSVSKSNYIYEYEVKVCKYDFRNDFKKVKKHDLYKRQFANKDFKLDVPNYFYYLMPEDLAKELVDEIPEYAGLMIPCMMNPIIKKAPKLKKAKLSNLNYGELFKKMYYRNIELKNQYIRLRDKVKTGIFDQVDIEKVEKDFTLPFY